MFRIISAPAAAKSKGSEDPVFIVGAPRTGSSFLVRALTEAAGFAGFAEGHMTPLMNELDCLAEGYFRLMRLQGLLDSADNMISNVPEAAFRKALINMFTGFKDQLIGNRRWLDKTVSAEAIRALPYVLSVWPRARILYLTRNGIANAVSTERHFGWSFRDACLNWTNCGKQWDRTRPELPASNYLAVRHEELVLQPGLIANQIATFIELPARRRTRFIEFIRKNSAKWARQRVVSQRLADLDWPVERRLVFLGTCGEQMCRQGYASTEEIAETLSKCQSDREPIDPSRIKLLDGDSPHSFRFTRDGFLVTPGRERATTLLVPGIETHHLTHLSTELGVVHLSGQPVRFEFVGIDRRTGAIVSHHVAELSALESRRVSMTLEPDAASIDLVIRVAQGAAALSNGFASAKISGMSLSMN